MKILRNSVIKSFGYSFAANCVSMLISAIVVMLVPKFIGIKSYGYYQLYLFYASYVGFFHFGWCDGIYLKYGGVEYSNYNRSKMGGQFWANFIFELFLSVVIYIFIYYSHMVITKKIALYGAVFNIVLVISKTFLSYLLQISNRIKEYALITIVEKMVYGLGTVVLLILGCKGYEILIFVDILGKGASLCLAVLYCKDIVFHKIEPIKSIFLEATDNVRIGIKLLIANIAGMLIIGSVRIAIENQWSIDVYSKVSLAINVSNLLMVFINAVGIVLFPMIKRMDIAHIKTAYINLQNVLMFFLLLMLVAFYPLQFIMSKWLPLYEDSFVYMSILFPICIFECKMAMLINTYLKALRKENVLLKVNLFCVLLSLGFIYISIYKLNSIKLAMIFIVLVFGIRCIVCEILLTRTMNLNIKRELILGMICCSAFIIGNILLPLKYAFITFVLIYMLYIYIKRDDIKRILNNYKGEQSR